MREIESPYMSGNKKGVSYNPPTCQGTRRVRARIPLLVREHEE
jgi:hypothetical protein